MYRMIPALLAVVLSACGPSAGPGAVTFTCSGETRMRYADPADPLVDIEATFGEGWVLEESADGETLVIWPNGECAITGARTSFTSGVSFYQLDTPAICGRSDPTLGEAAWVIADGSNAQVTGPQLRVELFGAIQAASIGRQPGAVRFDGRCE